MKTKRFLAVMMSTVMACSCMTITAFAAEAPITSDVALLAAGGTVDNFVGSDEDYLGSEYGWLTEGQLSSQDGSKDKELGNGWNNYAVNNPLNAGIGEDDTFRVWKLEINGGVPNTAHLWFFNDNTNAYKELDVTSFSDSGQGATAMIIMPDGYRLVGGCFKPASGINANYAGRHTPEHSGTVTVTADVDAYAIETTPHEYYEYDVQDFYQYDVQDFYKYDVQDFYTYDVQDFYKYDVQDFYKYDVQDFYKYDVQDFYKYDVQDFYKYDVQDFYKYDVQDFYKYDVQDVYRRYAQKYMVPVFEKKIAADFNDTMVTRLDYVEKTGKKGKSTFEAINGGAFNNGHTYVTINAEAAKAEGGLWFRIADSSKDNGKKNPLKNEFNRPIAPGSDDQKYFYNVKIEDDKLVVSVADGVDWAGIGAEAWTTAPKDAKNAPKHYSKSVTLDVPKPDKNGNFALYVHLEKLGWYERDDNGEIVYQFKEWQYDDEREVKEDYELFETITGEDYFEKTETGEDVFVKTETGEDVFVKTETGEDYFEKTETGEDVYVRTETGEDVFVKTETGEDVFVKTETGEDVYVKTETGEDVYVKTETGEDVFVRTETGEERFVKSETTTKEVPVGLSEANIVLTLTVDGLEANLNKELTLSAGDHTFVLSVNGVETQTKVVAIEAGNSISVAFDKIKYHVTEKDVTKDTVHHAEKNKLEDVRTENKLEDVRTANKLEDVRTANKLESVRTENKLEDVRSANRLEDVRTANKLEDVRTENKLEDVRTENKLEDVRTANKLEDVRIANELEDKYIPEYIYREDIKLGTEDDPNSEYAVKLN